MPVSRRTAAALLLATAVVPGCATPFTHLPTAPPSAVADPPPAAAATAGPTVTTTQFAADAGSPATPAVRAAALAVPQLPAPGLADLADLLERAQANSPAVRQAEADVAAARGAAVQAGLYPNPTAGYQGDQIGSAHTAGQQGAFVRQTFVTAGKLGLAQAAALADVARAEATLQQTRADLAADVRARYFAFTTADQAARLSDDLARAADALAERQRRLVESGQGAAPHEAAQARALAATARGSAVQARNRRTAAWKQLAVAVGEPDLAPPAATPADRPVPAYGFEALKRRVLERHPDLRSAAAEVDRARARLELARVTPYPNVEADAYVQRDYTTRTNQVGIQLGVALPVFDRNQGNIAQAEATLARATLEAARVRLDLTQRLAEAYERYSTNARLLEQYRTEVLPEQRKAFEGLSRRYEQEPGKVQFSEVVLAQQTLAAAVAGYASALAEAWRAVADLSRLAPPDDPGAPVPPADAPVGPDTWPDPLAPAAPR